jgi:hypothetical protein
MEQLEFLEQELKMMLENIERIKRYKEKESLNKRNPSSSRVVGELKHRSIALKQRLTIVSKIVTENLFQ